MTAGDKREWGGERRVHVDSTIHAGVAKHVETAAQIITEAIKTHQQQTTTTDYCTDVQKKREKIKKYI